MGNIKERLQEGGPGSGNFGHAGRPGLQGGSAPGGGGTSASPRERQLSLFPKPEKKKQTGSTGHSISMRVSGNDFGGPISRSGFSLAKKVASAKTEKGMKRAAAAVVWMQKKARHFNTVGWTSHGDTSRIAKSMGRHYRMKAPKNYYKSHAELLTR